MKHVMIDLETLGTTGYSAILSIGACEFDPSTGQLGRKYYQNIDPQRIQGSSKTKDGRYISKSTEAWWAKQSNAAKQALNKDQVTLAKALAAFKQWLPKGCIVWGNGATFDITILTTAYKSKTPWRFYDVRDMRTITGLDVVAKKSFKGIQHNALDDAIYQAEYVGRAMSLINKWRRAA